MIPTILEDGRRVQADECLTLEPALFGPDDVPELTPSPTVNVFTLYRSNQWAITCRCCGGSGEHRWSPSGHGVDPDGGEYGCEPCASAGGFNVATP